MGWRLLSQLLVSTCSNNELPGELGSEARFYSDRRIVDIDDQLPKR